MAESGAADSFTVFQYPALFALAMAVLDIALLVSVFPETLPVEKRAQSLGQGVLSTLYLLNPLSLFRFDALSRIAGKSGSGFSICLCDFHKSYGNVETVVNTDSGTPV